MVAGSTGARRVVPGNVVERDVLIHDAPIRLEDDDASDEQER
jgi:hypothetical protein